MIKKFLFNKRKLIFVFLVVFSIIQLPVVSSAYDVDIGPYPDGDIPDRPIYYGNGQPYSPYGVGVPALLPISNVDVFFAYYTNETDGQYSNYENASVTITNIYKQWVNGEQQYTDRTYILENNEDFGYRNIVSITEPVLGDYAYFYNYKCTFDFGSNIDKINSVFFHYSDFWYVTELKNPNLGYTQNVVRDILSVDFRHSYFNDNYTTYRVSGSFMFMGDLTPHEFDFTDDFTSSFDLSYSDIVDNALGLNGALFDPVPIYIQNLNVNFQIWNANLDSLILHIDVPVMLQSEHDAPVENSYILDKYAEERYSGKIEFGFDWLIDSVSAFFNAPLFEGLSFGSLVFIVLSISISTAVIALLSHLR